MTCIAAIAHEGCVFMAADSAGVGGLRLDVRRDRKIYTLGAFILGFTTSFRFAQIVGYALVPPAHPEGMDCHRYMATLFVDALRAALKSGGWAETKDGRETGGTFIVGYRGAIFTIYDDYQVAEDACDFAAVGSGGDVARGAMHATQGQHPHDRLNTALTAAEALNAGVRGPFVIVAGACRGGI